MNLYFNEAIEPYLGNLKNTAASHPEWEKRSISIYRMSLGFIHLFPCIYPFMHKAKKCPVDDPLYVDFVTDDFQNGTSVLF